LSAVMNNRIKKAKERKKERREIIFFIVFLIVIFAVLVFLDKKFKRRIGYRPFEGEIKTYDGTLHRNLTNPLGSE